ncbi:MAG TPA: spore coat protein U domain-containing protein [Gallionella sp.]
MRPKFIRFNHLLWSGLFALTFFPQTVLAAIFCNVSSPGFLTGYVPANVTTSITSTTLTVTCSRDNAPGPASATVQYQLAADNGLNALGTQNRAALAGSFLNYHLSVDAACATPWKGATAIPVPAASFPLAKNSTASFTHTFFGCILPGQLALPPEGTYNDTVTMTFALAKAPGASTFTGSSFPVTLIAPASCSMTTPPSNIAFAYTAFSPAAVLANSTYSITCTNSLAYTMSLDATVDVLAGLNYSLALNTTGSGGMNPLISVGTGVAQTFFINGTMAAGQAGSCATAACTGTQIRTLTITY